MAKMIRPSELSQPEQRRALQQIRDTLVEVDAVLTDLQRRIAALEEVTTGVPALLLAAGAEIGKILTEDGDTLWPEELVTPFGIEIATDIV